MPELAFEVLLLAVVFVVLLAIHYISERLRERQQRQARADDERLRQLQEHLRELGRPRARQDG
jgi:hypothetical protein